MAIDAHEPAAHTQTAPEQSQTNDLDRGVRDTNNRHRSLIFLITIIAADSDIDLIDILKTVSMCKT